MNKKVKRELFIFDQFCQAYGLRGISRKDQAPPNPDILLMHDNKSIAVELCELVEVKQKVHRTENESDIAYIRAKVESDLRKRFPENILLTLQFDCLKKLSRRESRAMSAFILSQAISALESPVNNIELDFTTDYFGLNLNIYSMSILRSLNLGPSQVLTAYAHFPPILSSEIVQDAIVKKHEIYKNRDLSMYNECWLLLHSGTSLGSDFARIEVNAISKLLFDKVFIYESQSSYYIEY